MVILMQENRSFDHYFGTSPGSAASTTPRAQLSTGQNVFYQPDPQNPDGYLLPYHLDTMTTGAQAIPSTSHAWLVQHSRLGQRQDGQLAARPPGGRRGQRAGSPWL